MLFDRICAVGRVCCLTVEDRQDSHKPVGTSDLRASDDSGAGGDTESPTRRGKAADGPLTARKRLISL